MTILWIVLAAAALVVVFLRVGKTDKKSREANEQVARQKSEQSDAFSKWLEESGMKPDITLVTEAAVAAAEKASGVLVYGAPDASTDYQRLPLADIREVSAYNGWNAELISTWLSASQYASGVKPMLNKQNYDSFTARLGEALYGIRLTMKDGSEVDIPCYHLKMEGLQFKKDESEQTVRFAEQLKELLG